ncbi:MAG: type II toxin-antitoxin system RelE/ParE family toxin [Polyangiaceae bacterium]|nr:type II toxin-antitoxin system RelE/ParE family toxin [Polyangiaceae bacterium]
MAEILLAASVEMAEAAAWYDERVSGLGERFLGEAETAFARIDETPLIGSPWSHRRLPSGVRRMFLRSFPYSAVYMLEPRLVVVALAHVRRRPGYWVKRLSEI